MTGRLLTFALALGLMPGFAAAERELPLAHDWYRTEIVIFERPAVTVWNAQETLLIDEPRAFPVKAVAFDATDEERLEIYGLPPETQAMLPYPTYDPEALAALGLLPPLEEPETGAVVDEEAPAGDASSDADGDDLEKPGTPVTEVAPPAPQRSAYDLLSESLAEVVAAFEADLERTSFQPLPDESLLLGAEARALTRTGRYRVILHRAWVQPVPERGAGVPVLIQAGERFHEHWLVEGTIAVTLGRYLHLDVNLWRQSPPPPPPIEPTIELRAEPDGSGDGVPPATAVHAIAPTNPYAAGSGTVAGTTGYMQLNEQRRLRSEELHYLDHPKFGVLVRIDPVPPSDAITLLVDELDALENMRQ